MDDRPLKFVSRRIAMDVLVGLINVTIDLESAVVEEPYLPVPGSRYLLYGRDCPDQIRQNDFEIRETLRSGILS